MKFSIAIAERDQRTVLRFESGPYDGIAPIDELFIENRIRFVNPDRLAIACALLLRDFICGPIEFPQPCSPELARGLEDFFDPLQVRVMNVEHQPFAKPGGARTALLWLPESGRDTAHSSDKIRQRGRIGFGLCSDQKFSSSIGVSEVFLASNLRGLASTHPASMALGILGLCFLYADDFSISTIVLPKTLADEVPNLDALRRLALTTNIELIVEDI